MEREVALELSAELETYPQSKEYLSAKLNCSEREIRKAVAELRRMGYNVCSNSGRKGYWLGDEEDKKRTVKEYRARAYALLKTAQAIELGPDNGQMEMEGLQ